jgi:hypothetical protein
MSRNRRILAACALVALAAGGAGCGKQGTLSPNRAPETIVFVAGDLDTVRHIVKLAWFGSDPDGVVDRYEFKWIYEDGQSPAGYDSSAWFTTARTESLFAVWTPNGASMPTFVVRAIDDENEPDPTPARQAFRFRNLPPTVNFTGTPVLPPTTFPVATVRWSASDPDGDIARAGYQIWLDGNLEAATFLPPGTTEFTIPPAAFSNGAGGYVTGAHEVFVRCIDDGGAVSPPASFTWNVTAPQGEVLLIDDVPEAQSLRVDPTYRNALNRQLGSSAAYTVIDLELANPFRSAADITATFGFFRSVIWYQEMNTARSAALPLAETAIRTHLAAGGNVYVCSTILVGTAGAIPTRGFLADVVGADSVRVNPKLGTTAFSIGNAAIVHPAAGTPYDSLRAVGISTNVDALVLRQAADAAFEARPIVLDSAQVEPWTIGVDRVPAGGSGRFVFLTFPLRFLGGTPAGAPSPTPDANYTERTIRRVLARFGHGANP